MPETDVTKMKVADLKRELKLRGLSTTGNKNELQDRLQSALIDGELSLEDTAISGEDLLEGVDDAVLTDEDEAKILGADENELLKSPTTTPTTATDICLGELKEAAGGTMQSSTLAAKKIVLKRKSSFTAIGFASNAAVGDNTKAAASIALTAKENTEPAPTKAVKMSERNPITLHTTGDHKDNTSTKVSQLSIQERLELRAKKFGLNTNSTTTKPNSGAGSNAAELIGKEVNSNQQIEMLKKRAERFGCVVSSKIAKIDADEKMQKRKQRFGGTVNDDASKSANSSVWAEKARQRLERFKTTSDASIMPGTTAADN